MERVSHLGRRRRWKLRLKMRDKEGKRKTLIEEGGGRNKGWVEGRVKVVPRGVQREIHSELNILNDQYARNSTHRTAREPNAKTHYQDPPLKRPTAKTHCQRPTA